MKRMIFILTLLFVWNAYGQQSETEPVTQKQFEKHQAKQKAKRKADSTPEVKDAMAYIKAPKRFKKDKFRMKIIGDTVANIHEFSEKLCAFYVITTGNDGFSDTGEGTYYIVAPKKMCGHIRRIKGSDISSVDLKVKFTVVTEHTMNNGNVMKLPGLNAMEKL